MMTGEGGEDADKLEEQEQTAVLQEAICKIS